VSHVHKSIASPPLTDPEKLLKGFPYWKRLHGFWRTLPNFNPHTASSEPGQDLAGEAMALIANRGASSVAREDDDVDAFGATPGPANPGDVSSGATPGPADPGDIGSGATPGPANLVVHPVNKISEVVSFFGFVSLHRLNMLNLG
jgi:hypothetical protein